MSEPADQPAKISSSLSRQALDECRTALLDTLGGVLRDFKYIDIGVVDATLSAAREQFDQLAGLRDRKTFESQRSLTASRISLVHEDDLEFSIRLSDLAQQLRESCELQLGQLHLRFMTLLDQQEAAPEQLPVGPETVGSAVRALAAEAGLTGDERIRLLQDMRSTLISRLRALYQNLNARLDELGIEQKSLLRAPSDRPAARNAVSMEQAPAAAPTPQSQALDPMLAGALRDRMISWLDEQLAGGSNTPQVARQLGRTELAGLLPNESRQAVDCIERVLDRLAAHPDIPPAAKQPLEGLRVPLLKLALRAPEFVNQPEHPARKLLTALAREASELPPDAAPGTTQLNLIEASVSRLTREYTTDAAVFAEVLAVLENARHERLAALTRRVESYAEGIRIEERSELARRHASKAIRALCAQEPPRTVQLFLEHYWSVVLRRTLTTYGERSEEWTQALKVADGLIWSMQPKPEGAERDRLASMLPRLAQHLQNGLDAIRVKAETRDKLLERFASLHAESLQGRDPRLIEPSVSAPADDASRLDKVSGTEGLQILRRPGYLPREPEIPAALSALEIGQSLRLVLPGGIPGSGVIAAITPARQVFLLQMRPDNKPLAVAWSEIARQQAAGTLGFSRAPALFDL
ncbi:DUF1631 family protein [Uliginosibacterium sp. H3]|uniref:DUF1631 family protein n=1 Tax=Uliginosibacterium silvisoli TaxID=3114758 RepID=A0ABU6K5X7_9RHOO|nr:DUF1631 family protein [Uliginosibacterium sp. H3]